MSELLVTEEKTYCHYHPKTETNLSCGSCGRPICPEDMVYAAVGIKCPECSAQKDTIKAKPLQYLLAAGAGLGSAVVGGLILENIPYGDFLISLIVGFGIGEAVSRGAGRNGGLIFQIIGGVAAIIAFVIAGYIFEDAAFWLFMALGIIITVMRIRS